MSIGDDLRNARRARGMTIERVALLTRISPTVLRALEADDVASLPGWVFVRGFLKSYAREVGLDPDRTVAAFLAQHAPAEKPGEESTPKPSVFHVESVREPIEVEPSRHLGQILTVAVIVIGAVAYLGLHNRVSTPAAAASQPASSRVAVSPAADVAVATAGSTASQAVAAETADLTLHLTATGECWVSATVDAEPRVRRLMNAGDQETIAARDNVVLRVGDPAALQWSINGAPARTLGEPGRPVTVRVTPQNAREYLSQ
jgi:cytoskeletal protein RodZ